MKDGTGQTPLAAAAQNGHLSVVKYLTLLSNIKINSQDDEGLTPLVAAAKNSHWNIVNYLTPLSTVQFDVDGNEGNHILDAAYYAARDGQLEFLKFLKKRDLKVGNLERSNGQTPLIFHISYYIF